MVVTRSGAMTTTQPTTNSTSTTEVVPTEKTNATRAAVAKRLWIGHAVACIAVAIVVFTSAGLMQKHIGAIVLVLCAASLRIVLALGRASERIEQKENGVRLALKAAVVFSENGLWMLATTIKGRLLRNIAGAVVDLCGVWLRMSVTGRQKRKEPFAVVIAVGYIASDIYLAGVIGEEQRLQSLFQVFMWGRMLWATHLIIVSAKDIVAREKKTI